jgi:hypothetical protein
MPTRKKLFLTAVLAIAGLVAFVVVNRNVNGPYHKGRTLGYWLHHHWLVYQFPDEETWPEDLRYAEGAITAIGTNAFPYLRNGYNTRYLRNALLPGSCSTNCSMPFGDTESGIRCSNELMKQEWVFDCLHLTLKTNFRN